MDKDFEQKILKQFKAKHKHDDFFRRSISKKSVAIDFLNTHLTKEESRLFELETLKLEQLKYDQLNIGKHECDALLSFKHVNDQSKTGYVLLEHQSKNDPLMPLRMLTYMVQLSNSYSKIAKTAKIPVILPIVVYCGKYSCSIPDNLAAITDVSANEDLPLKLKYKLVNIAKTAVDENASIIEKIMYTRFAKDPLAYLQSIKTMLKMLARENSDYILEIFVYIINAVKLDDPESIRAFFEEITTKKIKVKFMTVAQVLINRGREEGIHTGREEGALKNAYLIAKNMIDRGFAFSDISELTGLSEKQVELIANNIK